MQTKTPMVLVLQDGEEIHGVIEWYDKYCLKVNRTGATNMLIYKPSIKYMYKESEAGQRKQWPGAGSPRPALRNQSLSNQHSVASRNARCTSLRWREEVVIGGVAAVYLSVLL